MYFRLNYRIIFWQQTKHISCCDTRVCCVSEAVMQWLIRTPNYIVLLSQRTKGWFRLVVSSEVHYMYVLITHTHTNILLVVYPDLLAAWIFIQNFRNATFHDSFWISVNAMLFIQKPLQRSKNTSLIIIDLEFCRRIDQNILNSWQI